jgi:hypothetical protein
MLRNAFGWIDLNNAMLSLSFPFTNHNEWSPYGVVGVVRISVIVHQGQHGLAQRLRPSKCRFGSHRLERV